MIEVKRLFDGSQVIDKRVPDGFSKDIAPFRGNDWSGGSVGLLSYKVKTMTAFAKTKAAFAKTQATFNKTQTSFDTFLNKPVMGLRGNKGHAVIR